MIRYGATLSQMKTADSLSEPPKISATTLATSCDRLSRPRNPQRKFVYESRARGAVSSSQMDDLFPPHGDVEEVASIPHEAEYPEDWRRLPTEQGGGKLAWIYEMIQLDIDTPIQKSIAHTQFTLDRQLRERGATPLDANTTRRDVRTMVRDGERLGLLVDIVATKRNILSGVPHQLASFIYEFVEEKYPIKVKFALVGITDNATKLVARDIFDSRNGNAVRRLSFSDIDGVHLHIAHPRGDGAAIMQERGLEESRQKEEDMRRRRCTPKYEAPPPPVWMASAQVAVQKTKEFLSSANALSCSPGRTTSSLLQHCDRCWSHQQEKSTAHQALPKASSMAEVRHVSGGAESTEATNNDATPQGNYDIPPDIYTMDNVVGKLREVRRRNKLLKNRSTVVKSAVEMRKIVERIAEKN